MQTTRSHDSAKRLSIIATLAGVLERLESSRDPVDAEQYRAVVARLSDALRDLQPDAALRALFAASPATAELYENQRYQHAGLCLRPLDAAMAAEANARRLIARVRGRAAASGG